MRTLAKLRKSSSRFCSRWHSCCTTAILAAARRSRGDLGVGKVLGQQLHVQADGRQRILDLVRQSAGQLRNLGVLLDQLLVDLLGRWRMRWIHVGMRLDDTGRGETSADALKRSMASERLAPLVAMASVNVLPFHTDDYSCVGRLRRLELAPSPACG